MAARPGTNAGRSCRVHTLRDDSQVKHVKKRKKKKSTRILSLSLSFYTQRPPAYPCTEPIQRPRPSFHVSSHSSTPRVSYSLQNFVGALTPDSHCPLPSSLRCLFQPSIEQGLAPLGQRAGRPARGEYVIHTHICIYILEYIRLPFPAAAKDSCCVRPQSARSLFFFFLFLSVLSPPRPQPTQTEQGAVRVARLFQGDGSLRPQTALLFGSVRFCSVLFSSLLFSSVLFCSLLFSSLLFSSLLSSPLLLSSLN